MARASARRAVRRSSPGPTNVGWPPWCSPIWSASRRSASQPIPSRSRTSSTPASSCLVRDVTSFGGKVDKIVGDAIIALFGAPVAHEDDAERAVRAALRMQETLAAYRAEVDAEVPVQVRIGVNTGEVLVGALRAGGDYTAMGDVVNTAQRLQVAALPGGVVVGPSTYAATREVIAYRSLGPVGVKGRDEPVEAWVAIETLLPPGHRPRRSQTPFVGRDERARRARPRHRRHRRTSALALRAADRRGRGRQVPAGRGDRGGGPQPARRHGVRGSLRALRRGQRVVAHRRGAAPGVRDRGGRPAPGGQPALLRRGGRGARSSLRRRRTCGGSPTGSSTSWASRCRSARSTPSAPARRPPGPS